MERGGRRHLWTCDFPLPAGGSLGLRWHLLVCSERPILRSPDTYTSSWEVLAATPSPRSFPGTCVAYSGPAGTGFLGPRLGHRPWFSSPCRSSPSPAWAQVMSYMSTHPLGTTARAGVLRGEWREEFLPLCCHLGLPRFSSHPALCACWHVVALAGGCVNLRVSWGSSPHRLNVCCAVTPDSRTPPLPKETRPLRLEARGDSVLTQTHWWGKAPAAQGQCRGFACGHRSLLPAPRPGVMGLVETHFQHVTCSDPQLEAGPHMRTQEPVPTRLAWPPQP